MTEYPWFRLTDEDLTDIPAKVKEVKTRLKRSSWLLQGIIVASLAWMTFAESRDQDLLAGLFIIFVAVSNGVLIVTSHTQICLYRVLKELRLNTTSTGEQ